MLVLRRDNVQRSHLRVQITKTDKKTNHDPQTNNENVQKLKNRRKQNFEDEVNSIQFDKEYTHLSNLNSEYLDTWQSENIIEFTE